jgi:phosphohistidine phosphatase
MKTLFLIRHAKSSWDDPTLPDRDRPLNDRGRRDAPRMGKRLAKMAVKPDLILCSEATRALTTAKIIAKKLDYRPKDIVVEDRLYPGAVRDLLKFIHELRDRRDVVMIVGHDPALTQLARRFSGQVTEMPTCAVARFTFNAKSWRELSKATLETVTLQLPKKS